MLSTVEAEISSQPAALEQFLREDLGQAPPGSVFTGAGDSLAASLTASCLSSRKHMAIDPYELVANPAIAKGRSVYFVSASGRTASNIAAAKAVKTLAKERVAVTANPMGGLVGATDSALFIPCRSAPRLPGTLSFSLSLLALMKLALGGFRCDFRRAHNRAQRGAARVAISEKGVSHFLANGPAFPICLYSALKVNEMLGGRAQCNMLEEFGHAPLFALKEEDTVNIFRAFDPLSLGRKLSRSLRTKGFSSSMISISVSNPQERIFELVFLSQLAVLGRAKSMGLSQPYFVLAPEKLAISDRMIY